MFRDDLAILGAAWIRREPASVPEVRRRLAALGVALDSAPTLRFVLTWEADVADLDLYVLDANGDPAYLRARGRNWRVRSDMTVGFGAEATSLYGPDRAYPYVVNVFYPRRGAMGHAMGAVQVIEHDDLGALRFMTLPFVLMQERASLDVGEIAGPLIAAP